jgi:hypothetical protein
MTIQPQKAELTNNNHARVTIAVIDWDNNAISTQDIFGEYHTINLQDIESAAVLASINLHTPKGKE